ncbi:MAG: hypothetical protein QMD05_10655 [Candidatus Brocadiaceae bacterium]|nr:hypothetical protein [Candidatus Brocadiaceae bacterium]
MSKPNVSFPIEKKWLKKLEDLHLKTEAKKVRFIAKALRAYLEEIEDAQIALDRLRDPRDKRVSKEEIRTSLGL